jgi:hypothetical protein
MRAVSWSLRLLFTAVLLGIAQNAAATVTIELEWGECGGGTGGCTATGSDTIAVNPGGGQTLRLDIFMTHDLPQGIVAHTFSLNFDTNLENELNLGPMAPVEWAGTVVYPGPGVTGVYTPLTAGVQSTQESTGATTGRINSYESSIIVQLGFVPANGGAYTIGTFTGTAPARYRVGQAYFTANGAVSDGADVFSGLFNAPFDTFFDGNEVPFTGGIIFGTASLNMVPEPGTLVLLGLGLVGLLAARRSRA